VKKSPEKLIARKDHWITNTKAILLGAARKCSPLTGHHMGSP